MAEKNRASQSRDLRENGRQRVLDAIRAAKQTARIDISRTTGISPATVTAITSELIAAGLIEEVSRHAGPSALRNGATSERGRPRVALQLRGAAHVLAGLRVDRGAITVLIVDFSGAPLARHTLPLSEARMSPLELGRAISQALSAACADAGTSIGVLSGVGVAMSGLIDASRNFVHWSPALSSRNVALGQVLEQLLPCPVFLENDANLAAKAEQLFGDGRGVANFAVITVGRGVGMGVVLAGELVCGAQGCATELGHTKVALDGPECRCGQSACLEAYVGETGLLKQARATLPEAADLTLDGLAQRAEAGDAAAQELLHRAGEVFALGLANVKNLFDPALILVTVSRPGFDYLVTDGVRAAMRQRCIEIDAPLPEVRLLNRGAMLWARGAVAHAMDRITLRSVQRLEATAG